MEKISDQEFSTKIINQADDHTLQKSQIFIHGKATGSVIVGAILEACVRINEYYLVFMTDDIPSEDMLHIYLFNQELNLLDSVTIGSAYATGSFRSFELFEPSTVKFNFIGATQWIVDVFQKKQFHIPFLSDPKGVSRKICFSSYLRIGGAPISETA